MINRELPLISVAIFAFVMVESNAATPSKKTENKLPEKQEFGAHERPWAHDYLSDENIQIATKCHAPNQTPGLIESEAKVENALRNPNESTLAPLNAALADTTAALKAIQLERKRLTKEWEELYDARALVAVASRRAQEELETLSSLKSEVVDLIKELEIKENENIAKVSELVKNLKTKDAARLLGSRDPNFIVEVLDVLDPRLAADVLGKMDNYKAEEVMQLIATRGRPIGIDTFEAL